MSGFRLTGAADLERALRKAAEVGAEALAAGLRAEAEQVLEDAQANAPKDTGRLRKSGRVTDDGLEVAVSFDTPYAVVVHEKLGRRGAKYLERALLERAGRMAKVLADDVERGLDRL